MSGFSQRIRFDGGHPVLPGHFPGQPLVPAVLLLEQVALALRKWRGLRLARIREAKFVAPLLPDQSAQLELTEAGGADSRISFRIQRDGMTLARGIVEGAP
jgi:3-hydroxymyristoyl/3-hydroxydecanoyl-(acyl carrier protein) dehydratase